MPGLVPWGVRRAAIAVSAAVLLSAGPAAAACDLMGPTLMTASLTPPSVNVSAGPATVRCTMSFTDDLAGVESATCSIQSPFTPPQLLQTASCSAEAPVSGTPLDGTWQCDIPLARYSLAGVWMLASASATDLVGNVSSGFAGPATVLVTSTPDTVAPALTTFDFTPKAADVTASDRTVTCSIGVTDALAGVDFAYCSFTSLALPSGGSHVTGCVATEPSAGSPNNGTFSCTAPLARFSQSGAWKAAVWIWDAVGNATLLNDADLRARGLPETLTVTSTPDVDPPNLVLFDFNPQTVDPQGGPQTVTCTMQLGDALSGVSSAGCTFLSPFAWQGHSCTAAVPSSGTRQSGTFSCAVTIPRYSEGGSWTADVTASDLVGNEFLLTSATPLTVVCDTMGGGEATIRFADQQTVVWEAVPGASSYDVYRGLVSSLTDLDEDGLADGGYGECRNSTDPDTTDTEFVDGTQPAGGAGLFYLVAWVDDGGAEQGLGQCSTGLDRFPALPCP